MFLVSGGLCGVLYGEGSVFRWSCMVCFVMLDSVPLNQYFIILLIIIYSSCILLTISLASPGNQ